MYEFKSYQFSYILNKRILPEGEGRVCLGHCHIRPSSTLLGTEQALSKHVLHFLNWYKYIRRVY